MIIAAFFVITIIANFAGLFDTDNFFKSNGLKKITASVEKGEAENRVLKAVPQVVEKSIFESLVPNIKLPSGLSLKTKMYAYYTLKELDEGLFYIYADPSVSKREIEEMLGLWNEYIGWSDIEYTKLLSEYQLFDNKFLRTYIDYQR